MCKILKVSKSGYYAWLDRPVSKRDSENARLVSRIQDIHSKSRQSYGYPRVHAKLKNMNIHVGRNRVAHLMRENHIKAKRQSRYVKSNLFNTHRKNVALNLLDQKFRAEIPNDIWASDITSFWTGSGWLYLSVVMDLYSRRIIGWSMGSRMDESLAVSALNMALDQRCSQAPRLHHSDQGTQYMSKSYRNILEENNITRSMSRKGNCYDNAVVESFFKTLKIEINYEKYIQSREEAKRVIFDYIEVFYNRQRLHSTLGYKSPIEFESSQQELSTLSG